MVGLRLASVMAQSVVIVVTGLTARELGGAKLAQLAAALGVALAPLPLFEGTEFQYTTFDYLWWVLIAYFTIRLLRTENARWWLAVGATVGVGLMTKYTILFLVAGVLSGLVLTPARRYLRTGWFWAGATLAFTMFLPNLIWQFRHDLISLHFLQHIHVRDIGEGRANGFVRDQFLLCTNIFSVPLWVAGLVCFLRDRRFRPLAWMYLVPLALFVAGKGRGYYLAAGYPMLIAMGAVAGERWSAALRRPWRRTVLGVYFAGVTVTGLLIGAALLPLASGGWLRDFALRHNGELREEFGWNELANTVAGIRNSLPPNQQNSVGILVGNYGEQGAIEILGPAYHLPPPISLTNSAWLRSYPKIPPDPIILIGVSGKDAESVFTGCRWAGHNGNILGIHNEEADYHPDIFVCGPPRLPWPEFWKKYQNFG